MKKGLRVVLFKSRNKDNKDVLNFRERIKTFLSDKPIDELYIKFHEFKNKGVRGEFSRFYISVNTRDNDKIKKQLLHKLIDEDLDMSKLSSKIASIAAKANCSAEKKWMFDFDSDDPALLDEFIKRIQEINKDRDDFSIKVYPTPSNYAVIVNRGFDTRELLKEFDFVSLKRDDLLCVKWGVCNVGK